jgi:transcriptional regulator with XRE-family HTH domain
MAGNRLTARDFLARELRRAREAKGMTQKQEAKALYVSEQYIGHWETGRRIPRPEHADQLDELHGTGGIFGRMLADLVSTETGPEWFGKWPIIEERATALWSFQPTVVDGLLQTEDYARAVLQAGRYHLTDVEEMVTARLERQRILYRADPPILVVVMSESVLLQSVGDAKIMHAQLMHLADVAERQNVIVQIVPFSAGAGAGFASPFIIPSFDGGTQVAYVDNQLRGEVVEDPDDVATIRRMFELFRAAALSTQETIELIRRTKGQWTT